MKRNFVLIALVLALFAFALGCDKKDPEPKPTPTPGNGNQEAPPVIPEGGETETPAEDPDDTTGVSPNPLPDDRIPDFNPPDTGSGSETPGEDVMETPEELKIQSNAMLNRNLDGLKLYKTAPKCGNLYRLFLVKLYDGGADELYAMLDAESRKNVGLDLKSNRPYLEDDAQYEQLREQVEYRRKVAQKRADNEKDIVKRAKEQAFASGFASDLKMFEKLKAAYTKEMTPAEYYAIVAAHKGKFDESSLTNFLDPRLKPVVTETRVDDTHYTVIIKGRSGGKTVERKLNFALEDGEWKIADPFAN